MKPQSLVAIAIFSLAFLHCGRRGSGDSHDRNSDIAAKELAEKYKVIVDWDKSIGFTSYFQRTFIDEDNLLLFRGRIYDIVKQDSVYIVKVMDERKDADRNFIAMVNFTSKELNESRTDDKMMNGGFVIKVFKVRSSNPSIQEDEEEDDDGNSYTYSHLSDDPNRMLTIFIGKMVDCRFETPSQEQ
jgi:hypothetical protein